MGLLKWLGIGKRYDVDREWKELVAQLPSTITHFSGDPPYSPPSPQPPKPKCRQTWREIEALREHHRDQAEMQVDGFRVATRVDFDTIRISGGVNKLVSSWLSPHMDSRSNEIMLTISESHTRVRLNYDEALALYRGLRPLFGDGLCEACASASLKSGREA